MSTKPETLKKILIVGGGIGGLALAGFLGRPGLQVDLIEKSPVWRSAGAGITLGMNAMRLLGALGIAGRIAAAGRPLGTAIITDAEGRILSRVDLGELARRTGYPSVAIDRAALHQALLGAIDPGMVTIRLGLTLGSLDNSDNGTVVEFSDGRRELYDLVVGADGIGSQVRAMAFGHVPTRYSGYTCWRFVVEAGFHYEPADAIEMWGRGRRFGIVPIGGNRVYAFACYNAPAHAPHLAAVGLDEFREIFAGFKGLAPQVIGALSSQQQLIHNDIEDLRMGDWHIGRVVLLGDAAHAMTPNMGQGGAMAIEDAFVLADSLNGAGNLAEAMRGYLGKRRKRVDSILEKSYRIGRVAQLESPLACFLRDRAMRLASDTALARGAERLVSGAPDPAHVYSAS